MENKTSQEDLLTGKNILVIEDDDFISRVYMKWLTKRGAGVRVAHDGALGLEALKAIHTDLILLDLGMPGMDGYETIRRLKGDPLTKDIPVVILSNTSVIEGDPKYAEMKALGVSDILRKYETSLREIVQCISKHLGVDYSKHTDV